MEGQLWHPHPSSALCAIPQNLCPERAQTAVCCQEEGQCSRYECAQPLASVTPIFAVFAVVVSNAACCQIALRFVPLTLLAIVSLAQVLVHFLFACSINVQLTICSTMKCSYVLAWCV